MGSVESFLGHYDTAVTNVTRWHSPSLGGGGLHNFNAAIDYWTHMSHQDRREALNRIRNRRIAGRLREVDARFFLALKDRGHDVMPYKFYWERSRHRDALMGY